MLSHRPSQVVRPDPSRALLLTVLRFLMEVVMSRYQSFNQSFNQNYNDNASPVPTSKPREDAPAWLNIAIRVKSADGEKLIEIGGVPLSPDENRGMRAAVMTKLIEKAKAGVEEIEVVAKLRLVSGEIDPTSFELNI